VHPRRNRGHQLPVDRWTDSVDWRAGQERHKDAIGGRPVAAQERKIRSCDRGEQDSTEYSGWRKAAAHFVTARRCNGCDPCTREDLETIRRRRGGRQDRLVAERWRGPGHYRTQWRGQDDVIWNRNRYRKDRFRPRAVRGQRRDQAAAGTALPDGPGAIVPDSATVLRHERVRECRGGRSIRCRRARSRGLRSLLRAARALRPGRKGEQTCGRTDPARSKAFGIGPGPRNESTRAAAR